VKTQMSILLIRAAILGMASLRVESVMTVLVTLGV
jgi:hypothetical protein